ncbi:armadillo-type protein [Infundibulicybe gibba]|nr:armadillo-type protein [Infundibulicybe gibba]
MALDDDGLSTLEKIYLFSQSKASFHRIYIAHALPSFLDHVSPQEAIEYVLPLLSGLAMDQDEFVKEALAAELVPIIWWFFSHCQLIPDDQSTEQILHLSSPAELTIPVQAFTPILGTLLLSPHPKVSFAARSAVVGLLSRIRRADDAPHRPLLNLEDGSEDTLDIGLFGQDERSLFQYEILQQVVIGMGRLDVDPEYDLYEDDPVRDDRSAEWQTPGDDVAVVTAGDQAIDGISGANERQRQSSESSSKSDDSVNPYFPALSSYYNPSPVSSASSTPSTDASGSTSSSGPSPAKSTPSPRSGPVLSIIQETPLFQDPDPTLVPVPPPDPIPARDTHETRPPPGITLEPPPENWLPSAPRPSNSTLPPPRHSPRHDRPASEDRNLFFFGAPESDDRTYEETEDGDGEQAAVGRLSSMSLMAAVTASGSLVEETKYAFVKEVERVGRDPVYWVRQEASFALGALAKVVPEELVISSLLPLFESLRLDAVSHVRQSALFALPAILSRLSPKLRRTLALETILPLAEDESATVRSGTLETLGEVLHTFHEDENGPPEKLLQLFLGREEDRRVRDEQQQSQDGWNTTWVNLQSRDGSAPSWSPPRFGSVSVQSPLESFYTDPKRAHVCAFNYPAVTLSLGRNRWGDLRGCYLDLARNPSVKVRLTLAASLGEMAKIVGEDNVERDLLGVWKEAVRFDDETVRTRALECVGDFVGVSNVTVQKTVARELLVVWEEGVLKSWRERDAVVKVLVNLATAIGKDIPPVILGLLRKALGDSVAAVREAGVSSLPQIWKIFANQGEKLDDLRADIQNLAQSTVYRKRMTFVACEQALILPDHDGQTAVLPDDALWHALSARLVGLVCSEFAREKKPISGALRDLVQRLSHDKAHEVRSYVSDPFRLTPEPHVDDTRHPNDESARSRLRRTMTYTFSRPPPAPSVGQEPPLDVLSGPAVEGTHEVLPNGLACDDIVALTNRTFSGSQRSDAATVELFGLSGQDDQLPREMGLYPQKAVPRGGDEGLSGDSVIILPDPAAQPISKKPIAVPG